MRSLDLSQVITRMDRRIFYALGAIVVFGMVVAAARLAPPGIDWNTVFRPAARELLALRNPYEITGFYYPTWTLIPMLPFAFLPESIGRGALLVMGLLASAYAAYRLGATPLSLAAFLLSPPVLHYLLNSNIDWMVLLGFVLPPQIGLFFVVIKPQVGFAVALFWFVEAWRTKGLREIFRVFGPATLAMLLSFAMFGLWPVRAQTVTSFWWNASLWPASIPVGIALLVASVRRRECRYAMGASPCLSPYVLFHSWSGALAAVLPNQMEFIAAVIGLWILVLVRSGVLTGF